MAEQNAQIDIQSMIHRSCETFLLRLYAAFMGDEPIIANVFSCTKVLLVFYNCWITAILQI